MTNSDSREPGAGKSGESCDSSEELVSFHRPFHVSSLLRPLPAGTYRITTAQETSDGQGYRKPVTMIHVPAEGHALQSDQYVLVDPSELVAARLMDEEP